MNTKKEIPVESLHRGLQILEYISGSMDDGAMLSEIAEAMGLKRSTVHNLLKTLVSCGFAKNNGEGRYSLGWKVRSISNNQILMRIGSGRMQSIQLELNRLTVDIGENLVLAALINGKREVIARTSSGHTIDVHTSMIEKINDPIWRFETGMILSAYSEPEELDRIISIYGLPDGKSHDELAAMLAKVREDGYSKFPHTDIYAISIPVLDSQGHLLAAIAINQPLFRYTAEREAVMLEKLKRGAEHMALRWNQNEQ